MLGMKRTIAAFLFAPVVAALLFASSAGISFALIEATAQNVIDAQLRDRAFGDALFVSEVLCAVAEIVGVTFVNVVIEGHLDGAVTIPDKVDSSGNLVIADTEVITKGTVTITVELR